MHLTNTYDLCWTTNSYAGWNYGSVQNARKLVCHICEINPGEKHGTIDYPCDWIVLNISHDFIFHPGLFHKCPLISTRSVHPSLDFTVQGLETLCTIDLPMYHVLKVIRINTNRCTIYTKRITDKIHVHSKANACTQY